MLLVIASFKLSLYLNGLLIFSAARLRIDSILNGLYKVVTFRLSTYCSMCRAMVSELATTRLDRLPMSVNTWSWSISKLRSWSRSPYSRTNQTCGTCLKCAAIAAQGEMTVLVITKSGLVRPIMASISSTAWLFCTEWMKMSSRFVGRLGHDQKVYLTG